MRFRISSTHVVRFSTLLLSGVGLAGLAGWHTNTYVLLTYGTSGAPLRYNAALSILLLAIAIAAGAGGYLRAAGWVAAAPLAIGGLTVLQQLTGTDLGIDQLFMRYESPRMSPNAAFGISLASVSLVALGAWPAGVRSWALATVGAIVTAIGITAAFGYLIGLPTAYVWQGLTPLSPRAPSPSCCSACAW